MSEKLTAVFTGKDCLGWHDFGYFASDQKEKLSFRIEMLPLDHTLKGQFTDAQGKARQPDTARSLSAASDPSPPGAWGRIPHAAWDRNSPAASAR